MEWCYWKEFFYNLLSEKYFFQKDVLLERKCFQIELCLQRASFKKEVFLKWSLFTKQPCWKGIYFKTMKYFKKEVIQKGSLC